MIIGTVRIEEARVSDSRAGYHQSESGSFEAFWHDTKFCHVDECEECVIASGWYWAAGQPGCLYDGEPAGPFASSIDAYYDAQDF